MECHAKIRRFTVSTDAYTPITAPYACSYFGVLGPADGSTLLRSSDPENDCAWYSMGPGYGCALVVPYQGASMTRFGEGDVVTWLKLQPKQGGPSSIDVIVEFV
jgi:hypothetical protein